GRPSPAGRAPRQRLPERADEEPGATPRGPEQHRPRYDVDPRRGQRAERPLCDAARAAAGRYPRDGHAAGGHGPRALHADGWRLAPDVALADGPLCAHRHGAGRGRRQQAGARPLPALLAVGAADGERRSARREELSANLKFDGFILATITDGQDGPIAEGYQYVAGVEEVVPPVALAVTGPSREAYETGKPILVRNNPWRRSFEEKGLQREVW